MSILTKILGRSEEKEAPLDDVPCPHKALTARWDRAEDMGKHELATAYQCESCGETFSGDEGRRLMSVS